MGTAQEFVVSEQDPHAATYAEGNTPAKAGVEYLHALGLSGGEEHLEVLTSSVNSTTASELLCLGSNLMGRKQFSHFSIKYITFLMRYCKIP